MHTKEQVMLFVRPFVRQCENINMIASSLIRLVQRLSAVQCNYYFCVLFTPGCQTKNGSGNIFNNS